MRWQTLRSIRLGAGLITLLLLLPLLVQAQQSIVYGVFFYSPTCPHCHEVITNHWPGIQDEFGDQLQVLFIDVSTLEGSQIMGTAIQAMRIPSNGVPMLIIGSDVLIGSVDIPQRAPGIIRTGLNAGGIGYPPIPDIDLVFEYMDLHDSQTSQVNSTEIFSDPANLFALVVLAGLVGSLGMVGATLWHGTHHRGRLHPRQRIPEYPTWWMMVIGTVIGTTLAGSLLIGSFNDSLTLVLSSVVLVIFVVLAFNLFAKPSLSQIASWAIPLVILAGLLVAGYLAYVETTLTEATCGAVGDCNTVQQSPYAQVLGIPVGIIGILGYLTILSLWLINRLKWQPWIDVALFALVILGVAFSTYLTFLEPFVIGASCVWCLTSAVVMGILLWMTAPAGWDAVHAMQRPSRR